MEEGTRDSERPTCVVAMGKFFLHEVQSSILRF